MVCKPGYYPLTASNNSNDGDVKATFDCIDERYVLSEGPQAKIECYQGKGVRVPDNLSLTTGFGANSNQGQKVAKIGYDLGLLATNLNDSLIILPIPN